MLRAEGDLTPKGERRVAEILDATLRCLARDGYSGASLQRIADEAGLAKRTVIYYFGTREGLFQHVIRHVGDQMIDQLETGVSELEDPAAIVSAGFDRLWTAATQDRGLLVAWFGLVAEAATDPSLQETTAYINGRLRETVSRTLVPGGAPNLPEGVRRETLELVIVAGIQGLMLDYLERGDTDELAQAISDCQTWLAALIPT